MLLPQMKLLFCKLILSCFEGAHSSQICRLKGAHLCHMLKEGEHLNQICCLKGAQLTLILKYLRGHI